MLTLSEFSNEKSGTTHEKGLDCQFEVVPEYIPSSSRLKFELLQVISECNNVCLSNNAIMQCLPWKAIPWKAMPWMQGSSTSPSTAFAETLNLLRPAQQTVTHSYMRELKRF